MWRSERNTGVAKEVVTKRCIWKVLFFNGTIFSLSERPLLSCSLQSGIVASMRDLPATCSVPGYDPAVVASMQDLLLSFFQLQPGAGGLSGICILSGSVSGYDPVPVASRQALYSVRLCSRLRPGAGSLYGVSVTYTAVFQVTTRCR